MKVARRVRRAVWGNGPGTIPAPRPRPTQLPALAPPHRAYTIDVVGQALLASACGRSHRTIGADLGVPADTVRDWIRRVRARAQWLRVQGTIAAHRLDPMLPVIVPAGSALADAMSALATAAAAMVRRLGPTAPAMADHRDDRPSAASRAAARRLTSTHRRRSHAPKTATA